MQVMERCPPHRRRHQTRRRRGVSPRNARGLAVRLAAGAFAFSSAFLCATPASADTFSWPQPGGPGTPVVLTYSFSNLLDAGFDGLLTDADLRASTAEAFGLWSRYAPLNFVERSDSGPAPSDWPYDQAFHPDIRIGYHPIGEDTVLAHAFRPWDTAESGLAGDIHFNETSPFAWSLGTGFPRVDFLEVITHEIGHALGVGHILYAEAIMQPFHGYRFDGPGSGFLLAPDITAIRALYGSGIGSVHPIPEPATILLSLAGIVLIFARRAPYAR
jgi:hypothetical protein